MNTVLKSRSGPLKRTKPGIISAPILNFFFPGLAQVFSGYTVIGVIATIFTSVTWIAVLAAIFMFAKDSNKLLVLLTDSFVLASLFWFSAVWILVSFLVWLFSLFPIKSMGKSRFKSSVAVILITAVFLVQLSLEVFTLRTVQAQQDLLSEVFTSPQIIREDSAASAAEKEETNDFTLVDGRVNILLLGGDAGEGRWGLRPDSISVVSVNAESGETTIIGIPRNLQNAQFQSNSPLLGPFPSGYDCGQACLISYLYTYGAGHPGLYPESPDAGISAMQDVVQGTLGIEIPYVVLIDMAGFSSLVDALGGVKVCVPNETLAQDMSTVFSAGCQHMTGNQALLYSRTRYDSNDYGRMAKQRLVQQALLEQLEPLKVLLKFQEIASRGGEYISTNIPQNQVAGFVELGLKIKGKPANTLELVPPVVDVTAPDFTALRQMVTDALR